MRRTSITMEIYKEPWPPSSARLCYPIFMEVRKPCVVCNGPGVTPVVQPGTYYSGCDNKYMCFKEYHDSFQ
jgi:hypothetical protein